MPSGADRPVEENAFFREATLRICGSLDLDEALRRAWEYLRQHLPLDAMTMLYYDPARAAAYVLASVGGGGATRPPEPREAGEERPLFALEPEALERLRQQGASVDAAHPVQICNRPRRDVIYRAAASHFGTHGLDRFSLLMLRLDIQTDYQGVLWLAAAGHDVYGPEHARLAAILSDPFAIAMSNARRHQQTLRLTRQLAEDNRAMHRELENMAADTIIGAEFGLRHVMTLVRQVAPMNAPVLLLGETGTGKEVIAHAIHRASPRRSRPLVRVQCGAMPDALLDSELFGHEKGAFTGAIQAKRGRFERADGGTVFLDEIGELTPEAQVKLLRVLQDHTFERVGGTQTLRVDVRVIAATNRDLHQEVRRGRFREDLWFRLNVFPITLPPLRQRREDIPALVQHFVERKAREMGLPGQPRLAPEAIGQLQAYDWPGNVRELQNVIERALIVCRGRDLEFAHLGGRGAAERLAAAPAGAGTIATLDEVAAAHIRAVLAQTQGRVEGPYGAAAALGVHASTLRARMRKLGVPFGRRASSTYWQQAAAGSAPIAPGAPTA